ncbi:MAG: hypothetical protein ACOVP1_05180 [Bacteroidia bacterium]
MKRFFLHFFLLFALSTVLITACKNPLNELNDFKLNLNTSLVDPIVVINLFDSISNSIPKDVQISLSGKDLDLFYDQDGKYDFPVIGGKVKLILSPIAQATFDKPLEVDVQFSGLNYIPVTKKVYVLSKDMPVSLSVNMKPISAASANVKVENVNFNFLGKKRVDTVTYTHTSAQGIKFTYKFTTKGLHFVRNSYEIQNRTYSGWQYSYKKVPTVIRDSFYNYIYDKNDPMRIVNGVRIDNPIRKEIQYRNIDTFEFVKVDSILVGYVDKIKVPVVEKFAISDVIGQIYSEVGTKRDLSGFVDENNNFIDKPRRFNDVISIPEIRFFLSGTNEEVYLRWDQGISQFNRGRTIIMEVPENSGYKLFYSGITFDYVNSVYTYSSYTLSEKETQTLRVPTGYKIVSEGYNDKIFLYKNYELGCGFAKIKFTNLFDLKSKGFYLDFMGSLNNIGDGKVWDETNQTLIVPSFLDVNSTNFAIGIYHKEQCPFSSPLFYKLETISGLCESISSGREINYSIPYDGLAYLNTIPPVVWVDVDIDAEIKCGGGNFVVFTESGKYSFNPGNCPSFKEGTIDIKNGKGSVRLVDKRSYLVEYSFKNSLNEIIIVKGTIYIDRSKSTVEIKDENSTYNGQPINYYSGTLTYLGNNRFSLKISFDNAKLKLKIKGCNS